MFLEMTPGSIKEMYIEILYTLHQSNLRQIELNTCVYIYIYPITFSDGDWGV